MVATNMNSNGMQVNKTISETIYKPVLADTTLAATGLNAATSICSSSATQVQITSFFGEKQQSNANVNIVSSGSDGVDSDRSDKASFSSQKLDCFNALDACNSADDKPKPQYTAAPVGIIPKCVNNTVSKSYSDSPAFAYLLSGDSNRIISSAPSQQFAPPNAIIESTKQMVLSRSTTDHANVNCHSVGSGVVSKMLNANDPSTARPNLTNSSIHVSGNSHHPSMGAIKPAYNPLVSSSLYGELHSSGMVLRNPQLNPSGNNSNIPHSSNDNAVAFNGVGSTVSRINAPISTTISQPISHAQESDKIAAMIEVNRLKALEKLKNKNHQAVNSSSEFTTEESNSVKLNADILNRIEENKRKALERLQQKKQLESNSTYVNNISSAGNGSVVFQSGRGKTVAFVSTALVDEKSRLFTTT